MMKTLPATTELNSKQRIVLQMALLKQVRSSYSLRNIPYGSKSMIREDLRNAIGILRAVRTCDMINLSRI